MLQLDICPVCATDVIHPCYRLDGRCEDCFAANADRYHLPSAVSHVGRAGTFATKPTSTEAAVYGISQGNQDESAQTRE